MEQKYQGTWSTKILADYCWTISKDAPEQLYKKKAKKSKEVVYNLIFHIYKP